MTYLSIIDKLCIKRLYLPYNINLHDLRVNKIKNPINKSICDCSSCHIACIFQGELYNNNILSIGCNYYYKDSFSTIHAEIDAIQKLKYNNERKKSKSINLLVIRVNKNGLLQMSKPC